MELGYSSVKTLNDLRQCLLRSSRIRQVPRKTKRQFEFVHPLHDDLTLGGASRRLRQETAPGRVSPEGTPVLVGVGTGLAVSPGLVIGHS